MLHLRRATEADREYVRQVHCTAYRDMVIRQFGAWDDAIQGGFFDRSWAGSPYDIILVDGEACGFCCIHERPNCFQLVEFGIDAAQQGRGIGSQFLALFKAMAQAKDKPAQLNVMKTNTRAKTLYERCGFTVYGENQNQFLMRSS